MDRWNAPMGSGIGYRQQPNIPGGFNMSVQMQPGSSLSGMVPVNGWVNVHENFWTNPAGTSAAVVGSMLAHEEKHQDGSDGDDDPQVIARAYQTACLNPQA